MPPTTPVAVRPVVGDGTSASRQAETALTPPAKRSQSATESGRNPASYPARPPKSSPTSATGVCDLVKRLAAANVTVLELAATAHWVAEGEKVDDWKVETVRRKGSKTASGRLDKAVKLLGDLGLPPAAATT